MAATKEIIQVAGREASVPNPEKVYCPRSGFTKLDLVRYYLAVAEERCAESIFDAEKGRGGGLLAGGFAYRMFIWLLPAALVTTLRVDNIGSGAKTPRCIRIA